MLGNKSTKLASKMRNIFKRKNMKNNNEHKIKNKLKTIVKNIQKIRENFCIYNESNMGKKKNIAKRY